MTPHRDGPHRDGLHGFGVAGLAIPAAVVAAAALLATATGSGRPGHGRAIAFASTVCLVGAVAGWVVTLRPVTTPMGRVTAALAGVSLRLFPALLALGWLQAGGADLRAAGAAELLVIFYLAMLAGEIVRAIMGSRGSQSRSRGDGAI